MTRYRNFGSPAQSDEVVAFDLFDEQYKCKASLQGRMLIELVARADADNTAEAAAAVLTFFDTVMVEESRVRFNELTNSEDRVVSLETLTEIMQWLVEQYAGGERPTDAVIGILAWGDDHWPSINGRAILSGARLDDLSFSDFLDVLHYALEEHLISINEEHHKSKEKIRHDIYTRMYKRDSYIWVTGASSTAAGSDDYSNYDTPHVDPPINGADRTTEDPAEQRLTHKPYVPPTDITVENAGRIKGLEAPLG